MGIILSGLILILTGIILIIKPKKRTIILYVLTGFLFLYKSVEYTLYGLNLEVSKIPVEYSTITYFLFSISVLFDLKKVKPIASFMAFLSGLGYLIAFIFLANSYIEVQGMYITMMALINHSILFMGSMIILTTERFSYKNKRSIIIFTVIYLIYIFVIHHMISFENKFIFIFMLLDGNLLSYFVNESALTSIDYLVYFLLLMIFYQAIIHLILWMNIKLTRRKGSITYEHTV
jgi:hypothetical protein